MSETQDRLRGHTSSWAASAYDALSRKQLPDLLQQLITAGHPPNAILSFLDLIEKKQNAIQSYKAPFNFIQQPGIAPLMGPDALAREIQPRLFQHTAGASWTGISLLRVPACTVNSSTAEIISKAHLILDFMRLRDF